MVLVLIFGVDGQKRLNPRENGERSKESPHFPRSEELEDDDDEDDRRKPEGSFFPTGTDTDNY
jgi:hypothetical protein